MNKSKILMFFLIIFLMLNISYMVYSLFFYKKNYLRVDNDVISFDILDSYYISENYDDNTTSFKLYGTDKVSSVDVILKEQYPSNKVMYNNKEMFDSIFYQMLGDVDSYKELACLDGDDNIKCNYKKRDNYYDMYVKLYDDEVLVILYISDFKNYDSNILDKFISNIKVKNEKE